MTLTVAVVVGVISGLVIVCTSVALVIALMPCYRRREARLKAGVSDCDALITLIASLCGRAGQVAGRVMPSTQEQLNYGQVQAKPKVAASAPSSKPKVAPTSTALVVSKPKGAPKSTALVAAKPKDAPTSTALVVSVAPGTAPHAPRPLAVDRPKSPAKRVIVRNGIEHQHPAETSERLNQWMSFAEAETKSAMEMAMAATASEGATPRRDVSACPGFQARIRPPSATPSVESGKSPSSKKGRLTIDVASASSGQSSYATSGKGPAADGPNMGASLSSWQTRQTGRGVQTRLDPGELQDVQQGLGASRPASGKTVRWENASS